MVRVLTSVISLPSGPVVYVLDLADRLISKAGPFAAAGIMVGSIYWTAVTYGAVTVMQVRPVTPPQRIWFMMDFFTVVIWLYLYDGKWNHSILRSSFATRACISANNGHVFSYIVKSLWPYDVPPFLLSSCYSNKSHFHWFPVVFRSHCSLCRPGGRP